MAVNAKKIGVYGSVGFLVAALIIVGVVFSGVEIPSLNPSMGTLIIKVTDAPVDLDHLFITIDNPVLVHRVEGDEWVELTFVDDRSEVYFDLLELRDVTMDLCVTEVPPGEYNMIKIHITDAGAVYEGEDVEDTVPLRVPSNAIKVIVDFEVLDDGETTVLVDIEPDWVAISRSYNLRPVLKATVISEEGSE